MGENRKMFRKGDEWDMGDNEKLNGVNPVVKWVGGKRWLAPKVAEVYQRFTNYRIVEPFCGGAAISFHIQPTNVMLNDKNHHLINLYKWIQKGLEIDINFKNEEAFYYYGREKFNWLIAEGRDDSKESAQLFYYLNKTGYNGLCRFNKKGFYNVPFGKYKKINYRQDFLDYKTVMENWGLKCKDFEDLKIGDNDFLYIDPPYDTEFTNYCSSGFDWDDQKRLVEFLSNFNNPMLLSNQATDRVIDLYKRFNFHIEFIDKKRLVGCKNRSKVIEILAYRGIHG